MPKFFEVHPTNSQLVPSPIMGLEYVKGFPFVSDLSIYPFSLREPIQTTEILDPTMKGTLYISLVYSTIFHVFT